MINRNCVEDATKYAGPLWNLVFSSLLSDLLGELFYDFVIYVDRESAKKWLIIWRNTGQKVFWVMSKIKTIEIAHVGLTKTTQAYTSRRCTILWPIFSLLNLSNYMNKLDFPFSVLCLGVIWPCLLRPEVHGCYLKTTSKWS